MSNLEEKKLKILVKVNEGILQGIVTINNEERLTKVIEGLLVKLQQQPNKESIKSEQLKSTINLLNSLAKNSSQYSIEELWNSTIKIINSPDELGNYELFNILNELFKEETLKIIEHRIITEQKFIENDPKEEIIKLNYTFAKRNYDIIFGEKRKNQALTTSPFVSQNNDLSTKTNELKRDFSDVIKSNTNLTIETYNEDQTHVIYGQIIVKDREKVEEAARKYTSKENIESQFLGHIMNLLLGNELPQNNLPLNKVWNDELMRMYHNEYVRSFHILYKMFKNNMLEFIEFYRYEIPKYSTTTFEFLSDEKKDELILNKVTIFGIEPQREKQKNH